MKVVEMKDSSFIAFARPDITEREVDAATEAIESGWLTTGRNVVEFEREFAARMGPDRVAIAVNSCTAAMHLALESLGIGPGDEVLVPTWTFTATAEVVKYLGAQPVLVDVDQATLNIDFEDARRKVTANTKAVMPVHFAGLPVSRTAIDDFSSEHDLKVVEDAAHAFPAHSDGEIVGGGSSEAVAFSFYATKTITTGEGGMVVVSDPDMAARIRTMRLHGISRDVFDRYQSRTPAWRYEVVAPGFKYNLPDPAAAIGRVQLARADEMSARRAQIAEYYLRELEGQPIELPAVPGPGVGHAWHLFVVRVADGASRDGFIERLSAAGVGSSVHFIPLHLHPYWRDCCGTGGEDLPIATREFQRVVSLPIYSSMTDAEVEKVAEAVKRELAHGC